MPGQNLTRPEAAEHSATVRAQSYDIVLNLTRGETIFGSTTMAQLTATPGSSTFIDLVTPTVRSIALNGTPLDSAEVYADSRTTLKDLAADNEPVVATDCAYMHTGEGLYRFTDPVDGETCLYSQFKVPGSQWAFAVFEQPDPKVFFTFTVAAPPSWTVPSNSLTPDLTLAKASDGSGDAHTFAFVPIEPTSSYITAIVAGPYIGVTDEYAVGDECVAPLGVYCRKSLVEHTDSEEILNLTKRGFAYYEDLFATPYTLIECDQIFVPELNAGAIENAGCATHRNNYVFRSRPVKIRVEWRAVTILYELAHMWFGDTVTMARWNGLWLNESFAKYTSTLVTAEITRWNQAWTTFRILEKEWVYNQDQLSSTHPVAAKIHNLHDVEVNFDGIIYTKGTSALVVPVGYAGRESLFADIQCYLATHIYINAELSDLPRELEEVSGHDLSTWTRLWFQEAGVTTLRTQLATDIEGFITQAVVRQEIPTNSPASLRPHRAAIGCYNLTGQGVEARPEHISHTEFNVDGGLTRVPELVGAKWADVLVLNNDDLTYTRVRPDEDSLSFGLEHIEAFTNSLSRSIILVSA